MVGLHTLAGTEAQPFQAGRNGELPFAFGAGMGDAGSRPVSGLTFPRTVVSLAPLHWWAQVVERSRCIERLLAPVTGVRCLECGCVCFVYQDDDAWIGRPEEHAAECLYYLRIVLPDDASACIVASLQEVINVGPVASCTVEEGAQSECGLGIQLSAPLHPSLLERPSQVIAVDPVSRWIDSSASDRVEDWAWRWDRITGHHRQGKLLDRLDVIRPMRDITKPIIMVRGVGHITSIAQLCEDVCQSAGLVRNDNLFDDVRAFRCSGLYDDGPCVVVKVREGI